MQKNFEKTRHFVIKEKDKLVIVVPLFIIAFLSGLYALFPVSITNDPAIHSEIVNVIRHQGYPLSWEPYAANDFTYPPLFHLISFLVSMLGISTIDAVRIVGIVTWSLFPLCVYLLGSFYGRKVAIISSVTSISLPFLSNVFIFGEFPQLLSMELLVLEIYFMKKGKYLYGGIMTGLVFLTHPFMPVISFLIYLYFVVPECARKWKKAYLLAIPFIVSFAWLTKYFQIFFNMYSGNWQNIVYNEYQPVFWFWPPETLVKYLFGTNYFTPIIIALSILGAYKTKDMFMRIFFLAALVFSIYHIPYTQLKVFDTLAIPSIFLSSAGIVEISKQTKKYGIAVLIIFIATMSCFQVYHFVYAKNMWFDSSIAPEPALLNTMLWLGEHDRSEAKIYVDSASAWAGALSGKIPLEPEITYLESFSESYVKQIKLNKRIKESLSDNGDVTNLARGAGIKYIITKQTTNLKELKSFSGWFVYET